MCVCACVSAGALERGYACCVDVFLLRLLPGFVRGSRCGRIRGVVASLCLRVRLRAGTLAALSVFLF